MLIILCNNVCSVPSILRNNRFRRDARTLEEEEELWFDQDDELEEGDGILPMTDTLKTKLDTDFDHQINKILENKRGIYHNTLDIFQFKC